MSNGNIIAGVETGRKLAGNPFVEILSKVNESIARRTKESQEQRKEERQMKNLFLELGKKHEFEKVIVEETAKEKRKTEREKAIGFGGYDKKEDIPKTVGGERIKKIEQDPKTGKWFAEYGPPTSIANIFGGLGGGILPPAEGGGAGQEIRVKVKSSGQTGTIPANEYDPKIYDKL